MTNSILNITVSGFANAKSTEPKPVNLLTWLRSSKYRNLVEAVRQAGSKEERTELKKSLPAITPSGTFSERNLNGLVKHSGFLCLDIDKKDNENISNFSDLKRHLSNVQNFAYVGLSVSGNGYFCLVPILQPESHKLHFRALQRDLLRYGITVDNSGSDITRLRFYSFDPEAYFNHNATIYSKQYEPETVKTVKTVKTAIVPKYQSEDKNNFMLLLNLISKTGRDITAGYETWFQIGCSLANEFGETGRDYFHEVSRFNTGYKTGETDRQFDHCLKHSYQYTIKTFFHYCQSNGITIDQAIKQNPRQL